MAVSIVRADFFNTEKRLRKAIELIGYKPAKDGVILKPNAASPYGSYLLGDYTSPQIVEALIKIYRDHEIVIAEGAAVGMNFKQSYDLLGYSALAKKYKNVSLLDLNKTPRREIKWKYGKLRLPEIIFTHEYINLPKMKTHQLCGVTLGGKNQKGLLDEATKKKFHWIDIHDAIRLLSDIAKPDLTIIDGIICLEGTGPNSMLGTPKYMGLLLAGTDMMEVDNVACAVMKFDVAKAPHIEKVDYETVGESVAAVRKKFKEPQKEGEYMKFGNIRLSGGCSGCLESFSGLARSVLKPENATKIPAIIRRFRGKNLFGTHYIVMGNKVGEIPSDAEIMICMGNCSQALALEYGLPYIKGCPPMPEDILVALSHNET